ncbi:hypothetical protein H4R20_004279 [Coemansia guatemalensis]|uniref:Uncharacterized protein n=1 Tax=Coemansia guatemalensis TaxID=2761395 RepID=A0A9W8HYX9_9FUNG|nr:hypothetical protein H4R20_004279 [Coemansia guatemalensis]
MASPPLQNAAAEHNKTPAPSTPPLPPTPSTAGGANDAGSSYKQSQSAPPKPRTPSLLTSPRATQRNSTTTEAFRIARTLKEGFARLKARADPGSRLISPDTRLRTLSATAAAPRRQSAARQLARHHSLLPRYGSFSSDNSSNAGNGGGLDYRNRTQLLSPQTVARPSFLHLARSCPQQRQPTASPAQRQAESSNHWSSPAPLPPPPPQLSLDQRRIEDDCLEVNEAAETMILFMRSEPSSQNDPEPKLVSAASADTAELTAESDAESVTVSDNDGPDSTPPPVKRPRLAIQSPTRPTVGQRHTAPATPQ